MHEAAGTKGKDSSVIEHSTGYSFRLYQCCHNIYLFMYNYRYQWPCPLQFVLCRYMVILHDFCGI